MKRIVWVFWCFLQVLSILWLMADTLWPTQPGFFPMRTVWVQYSGVLAMGVMSLAMLLATRPAWIEPQLQGLDKMYRLHKWLGVAALVIGVGHWLWAKGTKWAVGWGWLVRPERKPGSAGVSMSSVEAALRNWRGLAEDIGEWAFYAAVVLIVLALVKRFPYHLFAKTHKLLAIIYLTLVFHTVVLTKFGYWSQPVGWVLAVLVIAGTASAVRVLLGCVGARLTAHGVIETLETYAPLRVLEFSLSVDEHWNGHRPGQFAFVTSHPEEGAHPYTIASSWDVQTRKLTFITKALGDYTSTLPARLSVGDRVTVEGPYGCFTFEDARKHQIWIGAGIGITPFIARMKYRAQDGGGDTQQIELFHTTADLDPVAIEKLRADAQAAGVRLHLFVDRVDGFLSGERLRALVPDWKEASFWFCGPVGFAHALRADLTSQGLPADAFHQELFAMR
ncbi:ferric reductase-like transmembrane domain-containing protein [Cupriavidus metallidurans]|uniref:ferredoxin reductase family protein n=1 Tax=Cupriavidus metallidurans TaxID=119219 RepID=UPI001CCD6054|nr:ferric reductase-like transmembrane domain-containing protein [Cupriavidus metallidurans]UBM07914.1 ferric reductase-like transmembrane domain-containing protein [Cupriavidus metallidurans]